MGANRIGMLSSIGGSSSTESAASLADGKLTAGEAQLESEIGPRPRPHLFVCKGCPAYETEDWREPSGDGETYDTGQYAWCNAADRRSMGAYHYDHTPRPEWCPTLPPNPSARGEL